ncbi:MAG TPA: hypothetical protein VGO13_11100 [Solirubrobacterales bacterium]|jgi:hypothetical protein|nr:hypothetical protein [Solirubrobacterales bacterium]
METVRDVWTDERLDDLNHRVDSGFKEVSREFSGTAIGDTHRIRGGAL